MAISKNNELSVVIGQFINRINMEKPYNRNDFVSELERVRDQELIKGNIDSLTPQDHFSICCGELGDYEAADGIEYGYYHNGLGCLAADARDIYGQFVDEVLDDLVYDVTTALNTAIALTGISDSDVFNVTVNHPFNDCVGVESFSETTFRMLPDCVNLEIKSVSECHVCVINGKQFICVPLVDNKLFITTNVK